MRDREQNLPDPGQISVFLALTELASVAKAAERLGMNPTTVSMTLARLRNIYHDELFVRTAAGMMPTVRAQAIYPALKQAIQFLQTSTAVSDTFDPGQAVRHFRLAMSEIGAYALLPKLRLLLAAQAPHVTIEQVEISPDTPWLLEAGLVDLVLGHVPNMGGAVFRRRMYKEHYACLGRTDHPALRRAMPVSEFLRLPHLSIAAKGRNRRRWEDHVSKKLQEQPNIKLEQSSFSGIEHQLVDSDLVAVLPSRLCRALTRFAPLMIVDLPFESPTYIVHQHWHRRNKRDAGAAWLRKAVDQAILDQASEQP